MFIWELRYSMLGLLGVIGAGTLGYRYIEGWTLFDGLWMVIITLTTIGYSEAQPLSDEVDSLRSF